MTGVSYGTGDLSYLLTGNTMLVVGDAIFLLIPSAANKRVLHPGTVTESDATSFAVKFEDPIAPAVGTELNAFCEVHGKFFQQGASVVEIREPGNNPVIAFNRSGEPVSAENRQTFRVSIAAATIVVRLEKERNCQLMDVSLEGFAVLAEKKYDLGSLVTCNFTYEGIAVTAKVRVQTMQVRRDGKIRYGLHVPKVNAEARKALQQISSAAQRAQLRRLRGAA
jgi:hypothetical protein